MGENEMSYLSMQAAAKRLGCSPPTVRRIAKQQGVGILADGKRIVAVSVKELTVLRPLIHETAGNPVWIAEAKAKRGRRRK